MLKQLTHVNVWVRDQDEALAFYTEKLGMELRDDVTMPEMGGFRWLTARPPRPAGRRTDPDEDHGATRLRRRHAGAARVAARQGRPRRPLLLHGRLPDDVRAAQKLGVEFSQEPTEQPYGIDAGFRDPSGNQIRMAQLK